MALGADVITGGNHSWDRKEILEFIPNEPRLLRPANFPKSPGRGLYVGTSRGGVRYAVLNLQGRAFSWLATSTTLSARLMLEDLAQNSNRR